MVEWSSLHDKGEKSEWPKVPEELRTQKDKALVMDSKWKVKQKGLTPENLDGAEKLIIRYEQQRYLDSELTLLRKGKHIKSNRSIHKLGPIIDEGILRIGGRLRKAA